MTADTGAWRGVAAEKADDVSAGLAALLRERSRRLLGDLLRPYRRQVTATISLIVVSSLAALAGPWLVGIAIDSGLPPLLVQTSTTVPARLGEPCTRLVT